MPMTRMLTRITSTITIFHMTPLLRSEEEVEVRRDTGDISVMVDVECENDRIDPWAEANISAFLTSSTSVIQSQKCAKRAARGCSFCTKYLYNEGHTLTPHPSLYWGVVGFPGLEVVLHKQEV